MATGNVKFILDADEGRAVRGFLKLLEAQNQGEKAFKRKTKAAIEQDKSLGGMIATVGKLAAGYLALNKTLGMVMATGRQYATVVSQIGAANVAVERDIRGLFALGSNTRHVGELRRQVLDMSTAFAQAPKAIGDVAFVVQSSIGDMSKEVQGAVLNQSALLSRLGVDTASAAKGGVSALLIYESELRGVGDAAGMATRMMDKLIATADFAKASASEFMQVAPTIMAAGSARGFGFDEVLGMYPALSAITASPREAGTALRNILNRLHRAEALFNVKLSGGPMQQLQQIRDAGVDIDGFANIFEQELAGTAYKLADMGDAVMRATHTIKNVEQGFSAAKLDRIRIDSQSMSADLMGSMQQLLANAPAEMASNPDYTRRALLFEAAKVGAGLSDPRMQALIQANDTGTLMQLVLAENDPFARKGLLEAEKRLRAGGDVGGADFLRLSFGDTFDTAIGVNEAKLAEFGRYREGSSSAPAARGALSRGVFRPGVREAQLFQYLNAAASSGAGVPDLFQAAIHADSPGGARITRDEFTNTLGGLMRTGDYDYSNPSNPEMATWEKRIESQGPGYGVLRPEEAAGFNKAVDNLLAATQRMLEAADRQKEAADEQMRAGHKGNRTMLSESGE